MLHIEGNNFIIKTPYNPDFINDLKNNFFVRSFDFDTKTWKVEATAENLANLTILLRNHFEYTVHAAIRQQISANQIEVKNFDIYYMGLPRERNDGTESSFATTSQNPKINNYADWNVVFPLSALKIFFEGEDKTDKAPRETQNYFQILKLEKNASKGEIKKQYKQMAKIYHPDVSEHPNAEEVFKIINQAYEVLSDPRKLKRYKAALTISSSINRNSKFGPLAIVSRHRGWYPPMKAGKVKVEALDIVGRWHVKKIINWEPFTNAFGQQMDSIFRDGEIIVNWR